MKHILLLLAFIPALAFGQEEDFSLDKEYSIATDGTLELSCSDAEVNITGSDRTTAHVIISRKVTTIGVVKGDRKFTVDVSEKDGDLIIREKQTGNVSMSFGSYNEDYTIDIEVPQGVSLRLEGDDGNLTVQRIDGAVAINNDDGDVRLQECQGSTFALTVDDGDIVMDQGQGTLSVNIDDGDITVKQGTFSTINVSADDGDVSLVTSLTDEGEYRVAVNDGEIDLQITEGGGAFDIRHDDTELDSSGPFTMVKSSDDRTQLTLPNGDAKVDLSIDDGHVELRAL